MDPELEDDLDGGFDDGENLDDAGLDDAGGEGGDNGDGLDPAASADGQGDRGEGQGQPPQSRVRNRASERVEEALARARQAEERAANLEAQFQQLASRDNAGTAAQERARVEAMDPWERSQYETQQRMERIERALVQSTQQSTDASDKAAFAAAAASNPRLKAVADRVESTRQQLMRQSNGMHIPRDLVAKLIIGEDALAGKVASGRRPQSERLQRNRTTPPGGRGDPGSAPARTGQDSPAARRKRLESISI